MVAKEPYRVSAGFQNLEAGIDSGISPNVIKDNQSSFGINVTYRNGFPKTRPGFVYRPITFSNTEEKDWFETHNVQAANCYVPVTGSGSVTVMSGGRIFRINVESDYSVLEITPTKSTTTTANFTAPAVGSSVSIPVSDTEFIFTGYPVKIGGKVYTVTAKTLTSITATNVTDTPTNVIASGTTVSYLVPMSPTIELGHMEQAEEFMLIVNGQEKNLAYNGASMRVLDEPDDLPVAEFVAYVQGRVWIAKGREFAAGDIVNGSTLGTRNILKFTENSYLTGGGAFALPMQSREITGMALTVNLNTSLGQGELLVGSRKGITSVNLPVDRASWSSLTYPVQRITALEYGPMSHESMVTVNSDMFYRSRDGIRSLIMAWRQFGTWGNTPISREAERILQYDSEELLKFTSAVNFDNRYLLTVGPRKVQGGCYFRGLLALDFDLVNTMGVKSPPAYEGVWTGINPVKIFKGDFRSVDRCFFINRNADGKNEFWEVSKSDKFDTTPLGRREIQCVVETKSYGFNTPNQLKRLKTGDIFVDNIVGPVEFDIKYRPDQYPGWFDWHGWSETANFEDCETSCRTLKNYQPQYKPRMRLPQPNDECETGQTKLSRFGYEFQARIQWTGYARVKMFTLHANLEQEEPYGECRLDGSPLTVDICPEDIYDWS